MFSCLLLLTTSLQTIDVPNSKTEIVDMSSDPSLEVSILQSGAIVLVHTTNGFSAKAYDYEDNLIGEFTNSQQAIEIGEWGGRIFVEKTGSNTQFAFSILMMSNLSIDKKCQAVQVSNKADRSLSMSIDSSKVTCLWLASPTEMKTTINSNVQGTVDIFGPTQYGPIETIENTGSVSITNANIIVVLKPSGSSTSLSANHQAPAFHQLKTSITILHQLEKQELSKQVLNLFHLLIHPQAQLKVDHNQHQADLQDQHLVDLEEEMAKTLAELQVMEEIVILE